MKKNDLTGLYVSYSLYNFSMGLFGSFLPIHLRSLGASLFLISLRSAIPSLIVVFAIPLWGMLSYKIQRRKLFIMLGMIARVFCSFIFIFLKIPIHFVIAVSLFSIFTCVINPNIQAFVTQEIEKKGKASGLLLTSRNIGLSTGVLMGGIIFDIYGIQMNYILSFLASALAALTLLNLKETQVQNIIKSKFFDLAPYKTILKNRNVIPVYITAFVYSFGSALFVSLFSVYFLEIGGSKTLLGLSNSVLFIIAFIVSTPAGIIADKIGRKPLMIFGTLFECLIIGILYFTVNPLITAMLWAFPLHPYIQISSMALIADYTTDKNRQVAMGLLVISQSIGRIIGPIIGGLLADITKLRGVIPVSTAVLFLSVLSAIFLIKEKT